MDYDTLLSNIKKDLTSKFDSKVADLFLEYIDDEELETLEEVVNEVNMTLDKCSLTDILARQCKWSDDQRALAFEVLQVACGLQEEKPKPLKKPADIDWTIPSKKDCANTLQYFNAQCHGAFKDQNAAHMQIATIGKKHDINLVPLLHDIYSFHKWKYHSGDSGYDKPQFCGQSPYLRQFKNGSNSKLYQALLVTLNSIESRMTPKFMANGSRKIVDDINAFIGYTLCVSTMLNNFINSTVDCCPLLVDFWIIPKKVKDVLDENIDDEEDSEDDEDSDGDDDDEDDDEGMTEDLLAALKKFERADGVKLEVGTVDYQKEADCVRVLQKTFNKLLSKHAKRSVKICIVIDRRKQKDNLLIYLLPFKYSAIPRNYCNETLIYSSANYIMYDVDNSVLKRDLRKYNRANQNGDEKEEDDPIYGASLGANGYMFTLSFALHEKNKTRIQFWREGGGLRFWPNYMVEIWPSLFLKPEVDKKYTVKYLEEKFSLSVKDEMFDAWYDVIAPPEGK